ncbi:AAA family ATPase [Streptomyces sp. NPDC056374]|uniref:AAA family ATPase n=1 Tax=unclassified Streptomyces TaxID=2593676 RepID=UPI0035D92DDB
MGDDVRHSVGTRKVLSIGLALDAPDHGGEPILTDLDPLIEAPVHAVSVSKALAEFGYLQGWKPGEGDPAEVIRLAVKSAETDLLVVHVVAHGRLAESGGRGLHVVGSDGQDFDDPVSTWIDLIESHPGKERPLTLFILDLCHSGAAATLPWHQEMRVEDRRAWVIAACGHADLAFDYRLSRAVASVLQGFTDGTLSVDTSLAHIPLPTVAREIDRAVAEFNAAANDFSQQIEGSRIPFFTQLDDLGFFPNPEHRRQPDSLLEQVDSDAASLLDEAFDSRHFILHGAGTEPLGREAQEGYFHGRDAEVRSLAAWFNGQGPGFQVVTGKPGVGKSALLGVLICAAHPALRTGTRNLWWRLPVKPALNGQLVVVHARHRAIEHIADSFARQLGADDRDRPDGGWDAQSLAALAHAGVAHTTTGSPYTLVIDALDEAERPQDIAQALLAPLARQSLAGTAPIRLLLGTRSAPGLDATLALARSRGGLLDLDHAEPRELESALRDYVSDMLAVDTPYAAVEAADAATALAEGIAVRLTGSDRNQLTAKPLGWGEFLVAGLYLRHVLTGPVQLDPEAARRIGLAVPTDLHELLELDLAGRAAHPNLRAVLTALAHAEGEGMPERILAHTMPAFLPQPEGPLPIDDARDALDQARFYLRRAVDVDGTTLYRLFHAGLAESLRTAACAPSAPEAS